jgi:hypothetical protein
VLAFRNLSPAENITVPVHLLPDHDYWITAEGDAPVRRSGRDLLEQGLTLGCPLLASSWVTIRRSDEAPG